MAEKTVRICDRCGRMSGGTLFVNVDYPDEGETQLCTDADLCVPCKGAVVGRIRTALAYRTKHHKARGQAETGQGSTQEPETADSTA